MEENLIKRYPLVSIVIPTYNREEYLSRAIDSARNQTYQNWGLIIVDDRSTDNTEALVREYVGRDKRIRYLKNTHKQGPAGARNQGIEASHGEYIAFLDSDDEWKDCHLEEIIEAFERNEDIDWIYADYEVSKDGVIIEESLFKNEWKRKYNIDVSRRGNLSVLSGSGLLTHALEYGIFLTLQVSVIRKKVLDKIRFEESLYAVEDRLLPLEAIAAGFRFAFIKKTHLTRYIHKHNISLCSLDKPKDDILKIHKEMGKLYKIIPLKINLSKKQMGILNVKLANLYFWSIGYNCYLALGNREKAKEYFLKALSLNPFDLRYWKVYFLRIILGIKLTEPKIE